MAVPAVATYSVAAKVAAHTAFKNLIDAGAGAGTIRIRDSADVLLAEVILTDPCGSVNGATGQLVFAMSGPDASADASGTAAYAEFCDSTGAAHLALPAQAGSSAVSGYIVLSTLALVAGSPFEILTATVG